MQLIKEKFGSEFIWGVSTSAYQIEGAFDEHGKGPSIWDSFTARKGTVSGNQHGKIACDFYNRYAEDIQIMKGLGIKNFRFSVAWSRILPNGIGAKNQKGIDFYNRLIDGLLEAGIDPWITLYHWDLPEKLQQKGGWVNRDVLHWFAFFSDLCVRNYGDRAKNWMVLNEPMVFTGAGYFLGVHAPGKKGLSNFLAAAHHAALCQAEGGRILRSARPDLKIGSTFSYSHIEPLRNTAIDKLACQKIDALLNRFFLEPLLGLGYPFEMLPILNRIERYIKDGDLNKLSFDMDFIGLQNYTREIVTHAGWRPFIRARIVPANQRNVVHTEMNWEVYPKALFYALKRLATYEKIRSIIVTENGAAFPDEKVRNRVFDRSRTTYLKKYIRQLLKAKKNGVPITGYFVWTLLDNFEWAEGFRPRFGIVHVDHETQVRTVKESGWWYSRFIKNQASL